MVRKVFAEVELEIVSLNETLLLKSSFLGDYMGRLWAEDDT